LLNSEGQEAVLQSIAVYFAEHRCDFESKETVQTAILEKNSARISALRTLYPPQKRPTIDELVEKLSNHAFLDRHKNSDGDIGFINDFIFGSLLSTWIVNSGRDEYLADEKIVDVTVLASTLRNLEFRKSLRSKLAFALSCFDSGRRFSADLRLHGQNLSTFAGEQIDQLKFDNADLGSEYPLERVCFVNCEFRYINFSLAGLRDVTFINCKFFACKSIGSPIAETLIRHFGCDSDRAEFFESFALKAKVVVSESTRERIRRTVLENFWPKGRAYAQTRKLTTITAGFQSGEMDEVYEIIDELVKLHWIEHVNHGLVALNTARLSEILPILGRS
jgi:hypothetical protein